MKSIAFAFCLCIAHFSFSQTTSDQWMQQANEAFSKKDYQTALSLYDQAVKADKKDTEPLFRRGLAKVYTKDLEGAIQDFTKVIKQNPDHVQAYLNRGNAYSVMKNYDKAMADFSKSEELNPKNVAVHQNRGKMYFEMKKYDLSADSYSKAIALEPNNAILYLYRADSYHYAGQDDKTEEDLVTVVKLDSTNFLGRQNLAFRYLSTEKFLEAEKLYEKLYRENPDDGYILNNYGFLKHKLGKTEEAITMIQRSIDILPKNAYAYKYLSEIYLSKNQLTDMCNAISKGLELGFTRDFGSELQEMKDKYCK